MRKRKQLLRSCQKKKIRPSVNTKMSGQGTISSYSRSPLLRDYKFTPKRKTSENNIEKVFWRNNSRNRASETFQKEMNEDTN